MSPYRASWTYILAPLCLAHGVAGLSMTMSMTLRRDVLHVPAGTMPNASSSLRKALVRTKQLMRAFRIYQSNQRCSPKNPPVSAELLKNVVKNPLPARDNSWIFRADRITKNSRQSRKPKGNLATLRNAIALICRCEYCGGSSSFRVRNCRQTLRHQSAEM